MSKIAKYASTRLCALLKTTLTNSAPIRIEPEFRLYWQWFMDLNAARSWHANGPNPISYADISEYGRLHRWSMAPHHVAVLRAMDETYIEYFYASRGKGQHSLVSQKPSGELSTALFDAVFG